MARHNATGLYDHQAARAAIAAAEREAGGDDAKFIEAINRHYHRTAGPQLRTATASITAHAGVTPAAASFHIYEDPRFLRNARELARRTQGNTRVIGGTEVPPGQFPDCVAVGSDAQWGCTGTLIGPNVVVTAGHCADFATRVFFGNDVTKTGKIVGVKKRFRHPKYHKGKHNDLLVLLLKESVGTVPPRKIATKTLADKMTDGRVVGFGHTDPSGTFGYGVKRQVDVPIASPRCAGKVNGHDDSVSYGCDRGLEIVAGRPLLARDSCNGDSGGPLYIQDTNHKWLIAGATSRATDSAVNNCGDGGIYLRIDAYLSWIKSIPGVKLG